MHGCERPVTRALSTMVHHQLLPLQIHPVTKEPILRLPPPHDNIIITPPRMCDGPALVQNLNDPQICRWLESPPYPYTEDNADDWLKRVKDGSDALLRQLKEAAENDQTKTLVVGSCPVRSLREVQENGTEVYIGEIGVDRCNYPELDNSPKKAKLVKENWEREDGDPEIVWCIGGKFIYELGLHVNISADS